MNKSLYGFKIDKQLTYKQINIEYAGFLLSVKQNNNIPRLRQTAITFIKYKRLLIARKNQTALFSVMYLLFI